MKKTNLLLGGLLLLSFCLGSCLGEGNQDCPEGYYLRLIPKNDKHNLKELANRIDLYFYCAEDNFYQQLQYTKNDLSDNNSVFVPYLATGSYKVIVLINHDPESFHLIDSDNYSTLYTQFQQAECYTKIDDLFIGLVEIDLSHANVQNRTEDVLMGKHTNHINIRLVFDDYVFEEGTELDSHIYEDNGAFSFSNYKNVSDHYVMYYPLDRDVITRQSDIVFTYTLLGLWTDVDVFFTLEEHLSNGEITDIQINLVEEFKKLKDSNGNYIFDNDEKLEYEDQFELVITLSSGFVVTGITVSGEWSLIEDDVEIGG